MATMEKVWNSKVSLHAAGTCARTGVGRRRARARRGVRCVVDTVWLQGWSGGSGPPVRYIPRDEAGGYVGRLFGPLRTLARSVVRAGVRIDSTSSVPADVRTHSDALAEAVEGVRVRFGVRVGCSGGGGGFGGRPGPRRYSRSPGR
jgi:hypothetical protein